MADTKTQNPTEQRGSEQQRGGTQRGSEQTGVTQHERGGIARRHEGFPSRDIFSMNPFSMMRRLTEEMDRAFSSTFGLSRGMGEMGAWTPPVEVRERGNNLEICAELPGMNKDDVKVEYTDEGIAIHGEKRRESETEERGMHRSERSYGYFYRLIPLPEDIDAEKAKAEFKDGVLTIRVPISEQQRRTRQIPISA